MKAALGLFHFNVQWSAGDIGSYHRYVNESFDPFLGMLERNAPLRVTLEIAGTGLEFLAEHYPAKLDRLRRLTARRQVELVSATFSPSAWIAYPGIDLRKSIEVNRRTLEYLELPVSRVFFAQEAFFGDGVRALGEYFDIAVCKDEYLDYYHRIEFDSPLYSLGRMKVLAASNHILNELSSRFDNGQPLPALAPVHRRHLRLALQECSRIPYRAKSGRARDVEWFWYHCGDGNHATTLFPPHDWERCYSDPWWQSIVEWLLAGYLDEGFEFLTVSDFVARLDPSIALPVLPRLIEGNWNCRRSRGVFQWMGKHENAWENDNAVLAMVCRTRQRVLAAESRARAWQGDGREQLDDLIETAWRALLLAESSDPLGWRPASHEVNFAVNYCDRALRVVAQIEQRLASAQPQIPDVHVSGLDPLRAASRLASAPVVEPLLALRVAGADFESAWVRCEQNLVLVETWLRFTDTTVSMSLPVEPEELAYSPSGLEHELLEIRWPELQSDALHLPLANGLLRIACGRFLVKDTTSFHLAARISRGSPRMEFVTEGVTAGRDAAWRFYIFDGTDEEALRFANSLNAADGGRL